jgi:dual-specificity kinase
VSEYYEPKKLKIKLIDFGGGTFKKDYHTKIVNTRQYRAPEVILRMDNGLLNMIECKEWDEKSDIWSIACILMELYSGELLFPTHHNYEHLALIEKGFGTYTIFNSFINKLMCI